MASPCTLRAWSRHKRPRPPAARERPRAAARQDESHRLPVYELGKSYPA